MSEDKMKLCKDCKHVRRGLMFYFSPWAWECHSPNRPHEICFMTGENKMSGFKYADINRKYSDCGENAKWFEPK